MWDDLKMSFNNMFHNLILEVPNVVKAILLLVLAWVVAMGVRALFQKGLVRIGAGRALGKTPLVENEEEGKTVS